MLYKSLISLYGSSLAGKSTPTDDPVWHFTPSEDLRRFREHALDALQQAKVYLLDHLAAAYADTLHDAVADMAAESGLPAMAILGEVKLPADVVWVEFDDRELGTARSERVSPAAWHGDDPSGTGLRGYLIDDRDQGHLRITMFHRRESSRVVDPICALLVKWALTGALNYDHVEVELSRSMVDFRVRSGNPIEKIEALRTWRKGPLALNSSVKHKTRGTDPSGTGSLSMSGTIAAEKLFWSKGITGARCPRQICPRA